MTIEIAAPQMEYCGEMLTLAPANVPFTEVVERLHKGYPVAVFMEPGDGTRYIFELEGAWTPRGHILAGGGVGDGREHIVVKPLDGKVFPIGRWAVANYIREKLEWHHGNVHTAKMLSIFLNRVWDGLAILRGEVTPL